MNLVSKEYVACQTHGNGVLILREFAGAAEEMGEAVIVNPNDEEERMAEARFSDWLAQELAAMLDDMLAETEFAAGDDCTDEICFRRWMHLSRPSGSGRRDQEPVSLFPAQRRSLQS